jgi:3-hydroxy-9,10-secoandrosta-1,3,5(10)-triene-9,17-dione monooxygenase reductase component
MGQFATGVAVVTTRGPAGLTTNAFTSLSLDPMLVLVCLELGSRTLAAVRGHGRLAVNVLAADQRDVAVRFSGKASHAEKFKDVPWREEAGVPVLDGTVAWVAGPVRELMPGGDHVIAIAEAEALGAPGGDPLLFHAGAYGAWEARSAGQGRPEGG